MAGLLARNRFILPSRPARAGQWNRGWLKRSCYLQLPVSPGLSPGSLLIARLIRENRNEYVNEQYNTTTASGLMDKN
jgi:hypothetical protein